MQIISEGPICIACKKKFIGATHEKWRLLPIDKVKDTLKLEMAIRKRHRFGLFCGGCVSRSEMAKSV